MIISRRIVYEYACDGCGAHVEHGRAFSGNLLTDGVAPGACLLSGCTKLEAAPPAAGWTVTRVHGDHHERHHCSACSKQFAGRCLLRVVRGGAP